MKTSLILALFGFLLAVGFSVAITENELADIADKFEAEKLRGKYDMKANDGEFDEEDLGDEDRVIPAMVSDMATEEEQFDERAFDNEDDGDEVSDEDGARALEKSADPFLLRRITRKIRRGVRRVRRPIRRIRRPIRRTIRRLGRAIRRLGRG